MKGYIAASLIVGASAIFSSLIISGNINFKDENVIPLDGGAIKLGEVYKENKLLSAKVIFKVGEQTLITEGSPDSFKEEYQGVIDGLLKDLNSNGAKNGEQRTADSLNVKDDATIELVSAVRYSSEHIPAFTLILEKKTVPMPKGSNMLTFPTTETEKFVKEQQQKYNNALYISK